MVIAGFGVKRLALIAGAALVAAASLAMAGAAPVAWIGMAAAFVVLGLGEALAARSLAASIQAQGEAIERLSESVAALWDSQQSDNGRLWNLENMLMGGSSERAPAGAAPEQAHAPGAATSPASYHKGAVDPGAGALSAVADGKAPGIVAMVAGELHEVRVQVDETATELRNRFDLMSDLITALQVSVDDLRLRANAAAREKA